MKIVDARERAVSSCVLSHLLLRLARSCGIVSLLASPVLGHADDITYGYDALGRLTSVVVAGATAYYDYDAAGNITAIRRQGAVSAAAAVDEGHSSPAVVSGGSFASSHVPEASSQPGAQ
ncbi:YD repeat-containing protein [Paraburkholderia sediminicola]|uniref:hypothetical protein n=1 Tax=Paraburkholderia sediminicola TaxID=458836 RepID=UPI0038BACCE2